MKCQQLFPIKLFSTSVSCVVMTVFPQNDEKKTYFLKNIWSCEIYRNHLSIYILSPLVSKHNNQLHLKWTGHVTPCVMRRCFHDTERMYQYIDVYDVFSEFSDVFRFCPILEGMENQLFGLLAWRVVTKRSVENSTLATYGFPPNNMYGDLWECCFPICAALAADNATQSQWQHKS